MYNSLPHSTRVVLWPVGKGEGGGRGGGGKLKIERGLLYVQSGQGGNVNWFPRAVRGLAIWRKEDRSGRGGGGGEVEGVFCRTTYKDGRNFLQRKKMVIRKS